MTFGFINVLKPSGITSHDVVMRVRKWTKVKQVGHAGTLDPDATGVLPLAIGSACRLLRFLGSDKIYRAEILLGTRTATDDLAGEVLEDKPIDEERIKQLLPETITSLLGKQEQMPPLYSAIHYQGKRLYELARAGKVPDEIKARSVNIEAIDLISVNLPVVELRIKCSGGTYIRSIARDLGEKLGSGACLKSLVREKSGPFKLDQAVPLETLKTLADAGQLQEVIIPPEQVLEINTIAIEQSQAKALIMGQSIFTTAFDRADKNELTDERVCLTAYQGSLIALCRKKEDNKLHPEVVVGNVQSVA